MPACTQVPPSPGPVITFNTCPTVTRCTMSATAPETNGDMSTTLTAVKAAWARCAAVVDMIFDCQARADAGDPAATATVGAK
ncbi:Rz1-like lysis system protein LysC [Burkholderia sp. Bp8992]|uniref:Rz1-like lysis system protein LysC n=1 Tax=Burkholderia sp. Bp8992 TaxID=2184554 RepID=UPI0021AB3C89|nr:Rz1-like lysis system protein LysC [Burkholderia sp. Bp8992]